MVDEADDHVNGEPTELLSGPPLGSDGADGEASVDDFAFGQYAVGALGPDATTEGTQRRRIDPGRARPA